jgi:hypothetical protein
MNCEEFEAIGLERGGARISELDAALRDAALEHAARCPGCASLYESWQEARIALQALHAATRDAETPRRVEMRLMHEFEMRHRRTNVRSVAILASWVLAGATVVFAGVSVWNWRLAKNHPGVSAENPVKSNTPPSTLPTTEPSETPTLVADNEAGDFTLLPGSLPQEVDDSAVVRVRMQRGALSALGLPVNEEGVSDWIQVDLLVGQDGLPKAVRLPE